jgi:uncharacterized protein YqgC (DUF456 family)
MRHRPLCGIVGCVDLADTNSSLTTICAVAIVIGVVGVIVPMLPGLLLTWAAVAVWSIFAAPGGVVRWVVLAVATIIAAAGIVAKYAWPGRNLKRSGVPSLSLFAGGVLGLIGFFVVPVVGLVLGFILGVWLAEWARLREPALAWPSTKQALKAAGLSMLIELSSAIAVGVTWVVGLLAT